MPPFFSMLLQIETPKSLWPPLVGGQRGRRGWRRRGRGCRSRRTGVGRTEQQARGVAVEVIHRAADIAEGTPAIGHERARALVEILRQFANRFNRQEQLAAFLATGQRVP